MARPTGARYPRELELLICEAIAAARMLEFDYLGHRRVVQPYCHGFTTTGAESLRAVEVNAPDGRRFGKLWTVSKMENVRVADEAYAADDPDYNPNDSAMLEIHCRATPAAPARRRR